MALAASWDDYQDLSVSQRAVAVAVAVNININVNVDDHVNVGHYGGVGTGAPATPSEIA